jgi:poly(hydroxyalkanoate) depolymerase family esterase
MIRWLADRLLRLRTWLLVRLGLWRGQWRPGRVTVAGVLGVLGPFTAHSWRYSLYAPPELRDDEAAPLVVVLHGCRQRALGFAFAAGLTAMADRARLRLLCPQQRRLANPYRCWNWFLPQAQRGDGELRLIRTMLDDAAARVRVRAGAVAAVGLSAGGGLAALLAFHMADRFRAVVVVAAPPLLGGHNLQDPREVMKRGLRLPPVTALEAGLGACAPLAIIHGADDAIVHPDCAGQLQEQAVASLARERIEVEPDHGAAASAATATDYRGGGALRLRRIEVPGLGHEWSGGPGGHPYCGVGGAPLADLCLQFLRDAGVLDGDTVSGSDPARATRPA